MCPSKTSFLEGMKWWKNCWEFTQSCSRRASTFKKNACGAGLDQIVEWDSRMKKLQCKCKRPYSLLEGLCCSNPFRFEFSVFYWVGFFAGSSICSYIHDDEMCRRTPPQLCLFNRACESEPEAEHTPWGPAITDKPTWIYMHINAGHQHTFPERPNESKSGVYLRLAAPKLGRSAQTQRERPNSNLESGFHLHKSHCGQERKNSTTASDDAPMRDPLCEGLLSERTSHTCFVSNFLFVPEYVGWLYGDLAYVMLCITVVVVRCHQSWRFVGRHFQLYNTSPMISNRPWACTRWTAMARVCVHHDSWTIWDGGGGNQGPWASDKAESSAEDPRASGRGSLLMILTLGSIKQSNTHRRVSSTELDVVRFPVSCLFSFKILGREPKKIALRIQKRLETAEVQNFADVFEL